MVVSETHDGCKNCVFYCTDEKFHLGLFSIYLSVLELSSIQALFHTANMYLLNEETAAEKLSYAVEYLSDIVNAQVVYILGNIMQYKDLMSAFLSFDVKHLSSEENFINMASRVRKSLGPVVKIEACFASGTIKVYWDLMKHEIKLPVKIPKIVSNLEPIQEKKQKLEENQKKSQSITQKQQKPVTKAKKKTKISAVKTQLQINKDLLNQVKQELQINFDFPPSNEISSIPVDLHFVSKFLYNKYKSGYMFTISSKLFNALLKPDNVCSMKLDGYQIYKHQQKSHFVIITPFLLKTTI